jgi:hypothetical protein
MLIRLSHLEAKTAIFEVGRSADPHKPKSRSWDFTEVRQPANFVG